MRLGSILGRGSNRGGGTFYGWYVVGAMFFGMFIVLGTRQGFGVFVETWEREWQVTTGAISAAAAVGWILNGFSQPSSGSSSTFSEDESSSS